MYEITDLKPGRAITIDGAPYIVVASKFGRKSQSKANMQCKLRNLKTGAVVSHNFQGSELIEPADVGFRHVQFLYANPTGFTFMDLQTYEQCTLGADAVGDAVNFLAEGQEVDVMIFSEQPIGVKLPPTVDLRVRETSPGVRGDTATGGTKPAMLETGLTVQVPLFVSEGDTVRLNTETGTYIERV